MSAALIYLMALTAAASSAAAPSNEEDLFQLTILHVNDIHVRVDETNKWSGNCKETDKRTIFPHSAFA